MDMALGNIIISFLYTGGGICVGRSFAWSSDAPEDGLLYDNSMDIFQVERGIKEKNCAASTCYIFCA